MQRHAPLPQKFAELGIEVPFLDALRAMGFEEPSEIQTAMIPSALSGRDILGQARTGTGKTAAYSLPALQKIDPQQGLQVICLAPTRELAAQVVAETRRLAGHSDLHVIPVYGGQKISTQVHLLGRKPHFVVGTPGRILDLIGRRILRLNEIKICILDEVDRMLDIGFRDDITRILQQIPKERQTIFVSATIDDEIRRLALQFMNDPAEVNVSRDEITVAEVEQIFCSVEPFDKYRLLRVILAEETPKSAILFCNTKHGVRKLAKKLFADGLDAKEIHGDLVQLRREKVMSRFRLKKIQFLVATDLAARGIDISSITHIINYDLPEDPEVYVHRIGRTARMGAHGRAISFVTKSQGRLLTDIEKLINKLISVKVYEGFTSRPPREDVEASAEKSASRYVNTSASTPAGVPAHVVAPPKTLGSKFRTRRRRL